jgi:putative heme-binding domain-containing protein
MIDTQFSLVLAVAILVSPGHAAEQMLEDKEESPLQGAGANPFTSASDVRRGHLLVRAFCSVCHGMDGKGGRGPSLTSVSTFRRGKTDRAILDNIKNGVAGTDMPAFPVEDDLLWPIVSYIRAQAVPEPTPLGDREEGAKLFAKHNCSVCHWKGTEGGRRGPDLSALAASADYVRTSILDPDANFRDGPTYQHDPYQRIMVVTTLGKILEGRWLNENAYFVQFMDEQESLHTIAREDIDEMSKPRQSLMPSFKKLLSEEELQDLIAYVFSLRPSLNEKEESE